MTQRPPFAAGSPPQLGGPRPIARTLPEAVLLAAESFGERVALGRHSVADRRPIGFADLRRRITALARGLKDAAGVAPADRVAILADNDWRWIVSDLAIQLVGAVDVPRAADVTEPEIQYILAHSECSVAIVQDARVLAKLAHVRDRLPALRRVVLMDGSSEGTISFDDVMARGEKLSFDPACPDVDRSSVATIVYTSGTTGEPKGVVLTHGNFLHNVETIPYVLEVGPEDRFLSLLPSWHSFERMVEYFALTRGASTIYSSKRTFRQDLVEEKPTLLGSVPRVWESLLETIDDKLAHRGRFARAVTRVVLGASRRHRRAVRVLHGHPLEPDRPASLFDRASAAVVAPLLLPLHALADRLVYRVVRGATGGRLRVALSGGGSLPARVEEFFDAAGIVLLNGYGLTETSPVVSVRTIENNVLGTIGPPLPFTEVRITDPDGSCELPRGERGIIWVRGPQVMRGYHRRDDETARVITPEGWFNTGDLGFVNEKGLLVITGRAKDTIVLRGGENVEPLPIEERLLTSPLVKNAVVVGQDRKTLGALIVPRLERLAEKIAPGEEPKPDLALRPEARDILGKEMRRLVCAEAGFKRFEQPAVFRVLPHDFSIDEGTLTLTLKLRRGVIAEKYAAVIDEMFGEP